MSASTEQPSTDERRTLWIVLILNAAIAAAFFISGVTADSSALIANGVDNLSDTAVYALGLIALSRGSLWKQRAAMASGVMRSEEHTSELQSLMRISYAVFCLKKKNKIRE